MSLKIIKTKNPPDKAHINAVEKRLGQTLPAAYLKHIHKHNGGRPQPNGFYFYADDGSKDEALVAWFFSIGQGGYEDLEETLDDFDGRVPRNLMPFGRDPGGSLLCLCLSGEHQGKVYFWLRELEGPDGELPDYRNVAYVADSMTNFLNGLQDFE